MSHREQELSKLLSPQELMLWHGMGAEVHPTRLADLQDAVIRETFPSNRTERMKRQSPTFVPPPIKHRQPVKGLGRPWSKKRVEIDGVTYDSFMHAQGATGLARCTINRMCARGEARVVHVRLANEQQGQGVENGATTNGCDAQRRVPAVGSAA